MKKELGTGKSIHSAAQGFAQECQQGQLSRREFLTRATALGVSISSAYTLLGLAAPAAQASTPKKGGTLKMQMDVHAQRDPRTWDWSEPANICRGWLEYLVSYQRDGSLSPELLISWEANESATEYLFNLRQGVKWNNGDDFTASDVLHNLQRWADASIEGNSMANRLESLAENGQLRQDAVEIVDQHTLKLHLSKPDIALMANLSDYPAAVVHSSFNGDDPVANPIGTGPYRPVRYDTGIIAVIERNTDHTWWNEGQGAWLDRIEFHDLGTDPAAWLAAAESGEIDLTYQSTGDFVDLFASIGMPTSEAITASTLAVRFNQTSAPFDKANVRRALQMAVDNTQVLEIGYSDRGSVAENHHVCPIHPEYAPLEAPEFNPTKAKELLVAEGLSDYEFELISLDDSWEAATCDNIAAQIRTAGINIKRAILPGATFWNDWLNYPFSATAWAMRPLGVQVLTLAYRSGAPWNESAYANAEFDALLDQANALADVDKRRAIMAQLQKRMQDDGVLIQPFWRSVYRNARPHVQGAEMHPTMEVKYSYYWLS